jgi:hypothetical protein
VPEDWQAIVDRRSNGSGRKGIALGHIGIASGRKGIVWDSNGSGGDRGLSIRGSGSIRREIWLVVGQSFE